MHNSRISTRGALAAARKHPSRSIAFAFVTAIGIAAAALWQTKFRYSGDLDNYSAYLINDTVDAGKGTVKVTALGTTMMLIDDGTTQILIDAFISPVGLLAAALHRNVATDAAAVDAALERVGADRVQAIFISHSHHDHAFDVAHIANRTGATVYGSESTLNIARGEDVPEAQLVLVDTDEPVTVGGFLVRTIASKHSPNPMGGEGATIDEPLRQPAPISAYKEAATYDFLVTDRDHNMLFKGSANWVPGALDEIRAQALFLGVGGLGNAEREFADGYFDATIDTVLPDLVVPTHWNDFFSPVHTSLPLQRKLIDNTPTALDRLLSRRQTAEFDVAVLDAYSSVTLPRATST